MAFSREAVFGFVRHPIYVGKSLHGEASQMFHILSHYNFSN
jgi:hypothetical protein